MSNPGPNENVVLLRERLARFLSNHSDWKTPLKLTLDRIGQNHWEAAIFGGVLRDLLVLGNAQLPRDVDIVVNVTDASELEDVFGDVLHDKTRFGGLRLRPKGWLIDVWTLNNTWAFRTGFLKNPSFTQLPCTTFLNVEAVAAEIVPQSGYPRRIYSAGFFEAVENKLLDINFEPNPYPALCTVRSIITALRLGFSLSGRLAQYIVNCARELPAQAFVDAQMSHYGNVRVRQGRLLEYIDSLEKQLHASAEAVVYLPENRKEQLELSTYWAPVC